MAKKWRIWLSLVLLSTAAALLGARWLFAGLPDPAEIGARLATPTIRITDRDGRLLYDVVDAERGRQFQLPLEQIPLPLQQATIATEDGSFYQNPGVDLAGIVRAFWINLRGGEVLAGGSTITQQVARNLLLDADERNQRTIRRKLRESWLAWRLDRTFEKEEILSLYLNQMYYGGMAYGVEAASQTYFAQPASQLTLAESALLAGLTQSPSIYNPFTDPEAAKARQLVVLELMAKAGVISPEEQLQAAREPLRYASTPYPVLAPHFVMMVIAQLDGMFTPEEVAASGGLTVRTTLNLDWQERAQQLAGEQLERLNHPPDGSLSHNARNAALVAIDPLQGDIVALVGNVDYFDAAAGGAINMAVAPRQPGSALKPIIYAAAMSQDRPRPWTAATMIPDVRTVFITHEGEPYVPVNFSREEHGPVLLRQALASSLNIPAVAALDSVGVETAMNLAAAMGLDTMGDPREYDLSFALGGGPVRLLDLTAAYGVFANGGSRVTPRFILEVVDGAGQRRYQSQPADRIRVLDQRLAWLISDILSDNEARRLSFGPNSLLKLDRTAAVKTGTTNDYHDNWTVGYTPDLVVGVWVGNADNQPMRDVTGISGAGPIWHHFMRSVLSGVPEHRFTQPPGLVRAEICLMSGLSPGEVCPYRRSEWFLAGTQPAETDDFFHKVALDRFSGRLASSMTAPADRVEQLVLDLPPIFHPWARAEGLTLLDDLLRGDEESGIGPSAQGPRLRMVSPDPQTNYRISAGMPRDAQQLRFEAIGDAGLTQVVLWLDGQPLATLTEPPFAAWWPLEPGSHQTWAEGRARDGQLVSSDRLHFTVLDVDVGGEGP